MAFGEKEHSLWEHPRAMVSRDVTRLLRLSSLDRSESFVHESWGTQTQGSHAARILWMILHRYPYWDLTPKSGVAATDCVLVAGMEPDAESEALPEPEIEPTYETEKLYESLNQFKMSMGLFADSYKLRLASNTSGL